MKKRGLILMLAACLMVLGGCASEEVLSADIDIMPAFLLDIEGKEYQYEGDRAVFETSEEFDTAKGELITELEDGSKIYRAQGASGYEAVVKTDEAGNQARPYFAAWLNFDSGAEALAFYGALSAETIISYEVSRAEGTERKVYLQSENRTEIAELYDILCGMESDFAPTESYAQEEADAGTEGREHDDAFSAWYESCRWVSLKLESGLVLTVQFSETDREAFIDPIGTGFGTRLSEEQLAFLKELVSQ